MRLRGRDLGAGGRSDAGLKPDVVKGELALRGVGFAYPARPDARIFDGLDLDVSAGRPDPRVRTRRLPCRCCASGDAEIEPRFKAKGPAGAKLQGDSWDATRRVFLYHHLLPHWIGSTFFY